MDTNNDHCKGCMSAPIKKVAGRPGSPNRLERGFTMIEVLTVVLILSIMATIGLPTLNRALDRSRLSGAADEVMVALEFAQSVAMTSGGKTRVTIDETANTILLERFSPDVDLMDGGSELNESDVEGGSFKTMEFPRNPGTDYYISFSNEDRFKNVDIVSAIFGAEDFVIFDAPGSPSSGGSVSLSSGMNGIQLTLDPVTGKVTASE